MATYKGIKGVKVQNKATDPTASEAVGTVWYNSTSPSALKYSIQGTGAWASATAMNTHHTGAGGAGTVTAALMASGSNHPTTVTQNSETYNGSTWTEGNNTISARHSFGATGTSTACIMAGGQLPPGTYVAVSESYDGTSWTEGNNILTAGRSNMGTVGTTTAALSFGRFAGSVTDSTETYDGTCWSETSDLQTARRNPGSAGTQAGALCIVGYTTTGVNQVESWDGTSWSETSTDTNSAKCCVNGKGTTTNTLIFGGEGPPGQLTETETFDGTTWTEVGDMAVKNYNMGAAGVNSSAALACGGAEGPSQVTTDLVEEWADPTYTIKTVTVS